MDFQKSNSKMCHRNTKKFIFTVLVIVLITVTRFDFTTASPARVSSSGGFMVIPALGRQTVFSSPITFGTLYDSHTHNFLENASVFKLHTNLTELEFAIQIENFQETSTKKVNKTENLITSSIYFIKSIQDKFNLANVPPAISLAILSELIPSSSIKGSSKFVLTEPPSRSPTTAAANGKSSSVNILENTNTVTGVKITERKTIREVLNIFHAQVFPFITLEKCSENIKENATHFVVGIIYGERTINEVTTNFIRTQHPLGGQSQFQVQSSSTSAGQQSLVVKTKTEEEVKSQIQDFLQTNTLNSNFQARNFNDADIGDAGILGVDTDAGAAAGSIDEGVNSSSDLKNNSEDYPDSTTENYSYEFDDPSAGISISRPIENKSQPKGVPISYVLLPITLLQTYLNFNYNFLISDSDHNKTASSHSLLLPPKIPNAPFSFMNHTFVQKFIALFDEVFQAREKLDDAIDYLTPSQNDIYEDAPTNLIYRDINQTEFLVQLWVLQEKFEDSFSNFKFSLRHALHLGALDAENCKEEIGLRKIDETLVQYKNDPNNPCKVKTGVVEILLRYKELLIEAQVKEIERIKAFEEKLNETTIKLEEVTNDLEVCSSTVEGQSETIMETQSELDSCKNKLSSCKDEKKDLKRDLQTCKDDVYTLDKELKKARKCCEGTTTTTTTTTPKPTTTTTTTPTTTTTTTPTTTTTTTTTTPPPPTCPPPPRSKITAMSHTDIYNLMHKDVCNLYAQLIKDCQRYGSDEYNYKANLNKTLFVVVNPTSRLPASATTLQEIEHLVCIYNVHVTQGSSKMTNDAVRQSLVKYIVEDLAGCRSPPYATLNNGENFSGTEEIYNIEACPTKAKKENGCMDLSVVSKQVAALDTQQSCVRLYNKRNCEGESQLYAGNRATWRLIPKLQDLSVKSIGPCF